jgi:hypothetical protein
VPDEDPPLPEFVNWPTFPFEGDIRVKPVDPPTEEPPRQGEDPSTCTTCSAPDDAYVWVSARWRVRALDRPTGLPMVLILESRSHLDLGDLPNLLAAELGVMVVRLERAIRSLEGVARVHVNRWGDGSAHLHLWFLARPYGRLQLRGTFLSLWDDILPPIPEDEWRNNLALVAAWLADFGGRAVAAPSRIDWKSFSTLAEEGAALELNLAREAPPIAVEPDEVDPTRDQGAEATRDQGDEATADPVLDEWTIPEAGTEPAPGAGEAQSAEEEPPLGAAASTSDVPSEEPIKPKPRAPRKRAPRKATSGAAAEAGSTPEGGGATEAGGRTDASATEGGATGAGAETEAAADATASPGPAGSSTTDSGAVGPDAVDPGAKGAVDPALTGPDADAQQPDADTEPARDAAAPGAGPAARDEKGR